MRPVVKKVYRYLGMVGINPRVALRSARGLRPFMSDYRELKRQIASTDLDLPTVLVEPYLIDRHSSAGKASGHYFHQDLLVARRIFELSPRRHLDVGSRFDGFVAHVAAFRPIEVLDVRDQQSQIPNVSFTRADLTAPVPPSLLECTDSLSSLHAIEHFGLGRYGDPVDLAGHLKAIDNFHRMLEVGGRLHLSVPIGPDRLEFNAQRVFSVRTMLDLLEDRFELDRFSYVGDDGALREHVEVSDRDATSSFDCTFGCGIFELVKRPSA